MKRVNCFFISARSLGVCCERIGRFIKPNDGRSGQTVNDMLQDIQENLCNLANEEVCPPVDQQDIADRIQNITRPNFGFQNPRLFS